MMPFRLHPGTQGRQLHLLVTLCQEILHQGTIAPLLVVKEKRQNGVYNEDLTLIPGSHRCPHITYFSLIFSQKI